MDVELVVVAECPNVEVAQEWLRCVGSASIVLSGINSSPQPGQPARACLQYPGTDEPTGPPDPAVLAAVLTRGIASAPPAVTTSVLAEHESRRSEAEQAAIDIATGR
jgi:hypothetical protein